MPSASALLARVTEVAAGWTGGGKEKRMKRKNQKSAKPLSLCLETIRYLSGMEPDIYSGPHCSTVVSCGPCPVTW